jgi:hypothetical protein
VKEKPANPSVTFKIAVQSDDADIRRLLRENPMDGSLRITLEREPSAFSADFGLSHSHHFVVARDTISGQAVGICERSVHTVYVNGVPHEVPYIGCLRVAHGHRNRISVLRGGFAKLRTVAQHSDAPRFAITSISDENAVALRILTAGLKGFPTYVPLGKLATVVIAARKSAGHSGETATADCLATQATRWNASHQFGLLWTERNVQGLEREGLPTESRMVIRQGGFVQGTIGIWDQRSHRQAVIRRYPAWLGMLRPAYNALARVAKRPVLPPVGQPMNVAAASHFSWFDENPQTFLHLIRLALGHAHDLGLSAVAFGFAAGSLCHQLLLKHFPRALEFRTQFFAVVWPDEAQHLPVFDGRALHPEIAVL